MHPLPVHSFKNILLFTDVSKEIGMVMYSQHFYILTHMALEMKGTLYDYEGETIIIQCYIQM